MLKLKDLLTEWNDTSFRDLPKRWSKPYMKEWSPEDGLTEQWFIDHSDYDSFDAWRTAYLEAHTHDGNGSKHIDEMEARFYANDEEAEEYEDEINFINIINVARGFPFERFTWSE